MEAVSKEQITTTSHHLITQLISSVVMINQALIFLMYIESEMIQAHLVARRYDLTKKKRKSHLQVNEIFPLATSINNLFDNFNNCERLLLKKLEILALLLDEKLQADLETRVLENLYKTEDSILNTHYAFMQLSFISGQLKSKDLTIETLFVNSVTILSEMQQLFLKKKNIFSTYLHLNTENFPMRKENCLKMNSVISIFLKSINKYNFIEQTNKIQIKATLQFLKSLYTEAKTKL